MRFTTAEIERILPLLHLEEIQWSHGYRPSAENAALPREDDNWDELPLQPCSKSGGLSLTSNSQLPVERTDTDSVGLGVTASTISTDPPN